MSNNLELKKQVVADISEKLKAAQSLIVVEYKGLTVEQVTELRNQFRAAGVEYSVLKNTLVKRAANDLGITALDSHLEGPTAFAFGMKDSVAPAKVISEFIKKTKTENLKIKTGLLGTEPMTLNMIEVLASLPSREVLLSRLLGSLNSTVASFARVLDAIAKKQSGQEA